MKTHTHPSGIKITFDDRAHRYTDSLGRGPYASVSSLVKSLFPPFDPDGSILARCAAREGVQPHLLAEDWARRGRDACELGTRVHAIAESVLLGRDLIPPPPATSDRELRACAAAWHAATSIRQASSYVAPEQIVADPESLTAGTMDALIIRQDNSVCIVDWKTNSKSITDEHDYGTRAFPPYSHLLANSLTKYSLQCHLYRAILLNSGYLPPQTPIELFIVHISPDMSQTGDDVDGDLQWIPALDLTHEADQIMQARRNACLKTNKEIFAIRNAKPGQPAGPDKTLSPTIPATTTGDGVAGVPSPYNEATP